MKLTNMTLIAAAMLLTGCAGNNSTRLVADALGTTVGAFAGNKLSKGSPLMTAVGAGGGLLFGEALAAGSSRGQQNAYVSGYEKGKSDTVKQHYQSLVRLQQPGDSHDADEVSLFDVHLPERDFDGTLLAPSKATLRITQ